MSLLPLFLSVPEEIGAQSLSLAHVTVTATLACKNNALADKPLVDLSLDDVIVTGRRYYPATQVEKRGLDQLSVSFDAPGGVYEMSIAVKRDQTTSEDGCSWNGPLMTLPGVRRDVAVTLRTMIATLWDRADFISGSIAGTATVTTIDLPQPAQCGAPWEPANSDVLPTQSGHYYFQWWRDTRKLVPGLRVDNEGHVTILALPAIHRTPLIEHAYIRRDISAEDLKRWGALPSSTIVCDTTSASYGIASPAPSENLQHVEVTAFIQCSDRNDLYSRETPSVEVEDQLHRGRFFYPPTTVVRRVGNVVDLRIDVPPGAYDLGMRLPRPSAASDFVLGCYSTARFAVLAGRPRHITFLICSCGVGGSDRGFVAVRMDPRSMRVGITNVPSAIKCGTEPPLDFNPFERLSQAVLDDGMYYANYDPYDPSTKPVLVISAPGMGYRFIALNTNGQNQQPMESLRVLGVTVAEAAQWYDISNQEKMICE